MITPTRIRRSLRALLAGLLALLNVPGDGRRLLADSAIAAVGTPPAAGAMIPYRVDHDGYVSLAVYDQDDRLLRSLLVGQPVKAGDQAIAWDGLDRHGLPQPPGTYTWKLLHTPGFEAKFIGSVGINIVEPPYDPWVGNNDGPSAVAWDDTGWYVGSIASETVPTFRKQSPDGSQRLWQKDAMEAWQGPMAMASANGTLFVLQQNAKVVPVDAATNAHQTYGDDLGKRRPAGWDVLAPGDNRTGSGGKASGPMDLDAHADRFVVTYEKFDLVRWYSSQPLAIPNRTSEAALQALSAAQTLREESIPGPKAVALGADGVAYVVSEGAVLAVGDQRRVFIAADLLENPHRLAVDRSTGELLVGEAAPGHQIKRFDQDGKLIATYGRPGGREDGPFVAEDFQNLRDLVATADGGFLICEGGASLRRTARFDRAGKTTGQWFGGSPYFNFASAAPEDPSEIWFRSGYACYGVAKVDLNSGAWELTASYTVPPFGEGLFPKHEPFAQWHVRRRNGITYLTHDRSAILRLDPPSQRLLPVAIAGTASKDNPVWLAAVAFQKLEASTLGGAYTWSDLNGDGDFQPDEFRLGGTMQRGGVAHCHLDEQWNLTFGRDGSPIPWIRLPNLAPAGSAVPVWDWRQAAPANAAWPPEIAALGSIESRGVWRDPDGATFQFIAANRHPNDDRHGSSWPTNRSGSVRLLKWNADGTLAWNVGKHAHLDAWRHAIPAAYSDPARILGLVHGCLIVGDRSGWPATAWTTDGLYAGSLLDRRADDGLPARVYSVWREKRPLPDQPDQLDNPHAMHPDTPIPWDCLTGGSIVPLPDGEALWMPQGENAPPLYRLRGWHDGQRRQGQITLTATPPAATATGSGLAAEYFDNPQLDGDPIHTRLDQRIWFGHKVDRNKWLPWSKPPVPGLPEQGFSARWTGWLEPKLSETYTFSAYVGPQDRLRLWVDNQLLIDEWAAPDPKRRRPKATWAASDELVSQPLPLAAGTPVPIRLEYANEGPEQASLSLNWDSSTQERQRLPSQQLYPPTAAAPTTQNE